MTDTIIKRSPKEKLFAKLYLEAFPALARYISKNGGDFEETRDIFQEALLIFYEKTVINHFDPGVSDNAYLLGIGRNLWLKKSVRSFKTESLENVDVVESKHEEPISERLNSFLKTAGQKCMDMLQSFYYERMSMSDISTQFGFSNERSATVQKYKCLEKVREQIKTKSLKYEDFIS
ncbi:hypothetical protein GCM10011506_22000 [Marivirga lumbricoides]|uniref:RNA polymerase subunit sigma-70 n=1 Tax=Marivirga lumbricoides TaxID=1046115 RepID=A0ABQ1M8E2_9BACT|nr:hypothetical protein GCM10011506_22000 [Marivirga lumbricoides]